jgi:hypothetical protein
MEGSVKASGVIVLVGAVVVMIVAGCTGAPQKPEGALSVGELVVNPVYDTQVRVFGKVSLLGELLCPCFVLISDGESLEVWYGLMVEDSGTPRPDVNVDAISNGDWVVVTGELKNSGVHVSQDDFLVSAIETVR